MNKTNKILIALVAVLVVVLGVIVFWQKGGFERSYYAVYLNTGDIYFGKLSRFPRLVLSNVWLLQRNSNDTENPFGISRFSEAFWNPKDTIYLESENVVWIAELSSESQLVQLFKNPSQFQNQQPQQQQQTNATTTRK